MKLFKKYYYPPVNFWSVWFSEIVIRSLKRNGYTVNGSDNVLDVGCGLGNHCFSMLAYKPRSVTGFDISNETVELLKSFSDEIYFRKIDICIDDITEYRSKFSVVFSCDVYEHVNDPQVMLNNLYYVLKEGGVVSVTYPNFDNHGHNQIKNVNELSEKLKNAGFKDHKIDIIKDRTLIYRFYTGIYTILQNLSDRMYGIERNKINRMPESDEFHEMYAYKKINKIKDKKMLIFIINFAYNLLKKFARLTSVYTTEMNLNNVKDKRIVFWAVK